MAVAEAYHAYEQGSQVSPLSAAAVSNQTIQESQRLLLLVRAYQVSESTCPTLRGCSIMRVLHACPARPRNMCLALSTSGVRMQVNGHFMANLDPLGMDKRPMPIELDPALYGFSDKDLDRE